MATNNAINLNSSGIVSYDGAGTFSALANPLIVANGGTGDASLTAYAVLCGGTTSTAAIQSIAGVGTSAQALTSNGAGQLPTFQNLAVGDGYVLVMQPTGGALPGDNATYFLGFGEILTSITSSGSAAAKIYIPKAATVTACYGAFTCTPGSSENCTLALRLNNSSDTTITSTLQLNVSPVAISNSSLSLAVVAGDYLEFKLTTPTWTSNPTSLACSLTLYLS